MKHGWLDELRMWWVWHKQTAGLVIAAVAFVFLAVLVAPFSAGTAFEGKVVELRHLSSKFGNDTYAVVDLSGHRAMVGLDPGHGCGVGSAISLRKLRTLTGGRYAALRGCHSAGRDTGRSPAP
jgi:hypothetical protein